MRVDEVGLKRINYSDLVGFGLKRGKSTTIGDRSGFIDEES